MSKEILSEPCDLLGSILWRRCLAGSSDLAARGEHLASPSCKAQDCWVSTGAFALSVWKISALCHSSCQPFKTVPYQTVIYLLIYRSAKRIQISPITECYVLNLPLFSWKPTTILIADTDIRRKTVLLLPPHVARTPKPSALDRYLMGDTFRKSHWL